MLEFDSAHPFIACFVILRRENKVAFLLRKNTQWMDGFYGLPAGKVEWGESYTAGAIREAKEEAGVTIEAGDLRFVHMCHRHSDESDWVDVFFEAEKWVGEPENMETHKSESLDWLDLDNLPENMIPVLRFCLDKIHSNTYFSEYNWEK